MRAPVPVPGLAPASPPNMVAMHGTLAQPAIAPDSMSASPARVQLAPQPFNGLAAMRLARQLTLPSGHDAVSSAAILNRIVSVDSSGAVFLSQDAGKHWEAVLTQWKGKAILVQAPSQRMLRISAEPSPGPLSGAVLESTPEEDRKSQKAGVDSPSITSSAAAAKASLASPAPAPLFKLVTDRQQTWVSPDGKVWRPQ